MGVRVRACDATGATLSAPLAPNINHRSTVFGGSASAVAILAGWTWLHFALRGAGYPVRLVIQENTMRYLAPITGDFEARCSPPPPPKFEQFVKTLQRHGKARMRLTATLVRDGATVAEFSGEYVAFSLTADTGRDASPRRS
jgi:thioesterase domain-containing protein